MLPNNCIILGGGSSFGPEARQIVEALSPNALVIGTNYSYHFFPNADVHCVTDPEFFEANTADLKKLPLVVGRFTSSSKNAKMSNAVLLETTPEAKWHDVDTLTKVYSYLLVGSFALSVAAHLYAVDNRTTEANIYLMGYDFGDTVKPGITHFYQAEAANNDKLRHRGIGYTKWYNEIDPDKFFAPYKTATGYGSAYSIRNVSPTSKITIFPKVTAEEMRDSINVSGPTPHDQTVLRDSIRAEVSKYARKE